MKELATIVKAWIASREGGPVFEAPQYYGEVLAANGDFAPALIFEAGHIEEHFTTEESGRIGMYVLARYDEYLDEIRYHQCVHTKQFDELMDSGWCVVLPYPRTRGTLVYWFEDGNPACRTKKVLEWIRSLPKKTKRHKLALEWAEKEEE